MWDSELFIFENREHAQKVLQSLSSSLHFSALARSLHTLSSPKLAIVATSFDDLKLKLERAIARYGSDIHDVTGIYSAREGLYSKGKIAFLFPGEGAQYVNMLLDLVEHFPVVREFVALSDSLSREGKAISQEIASQEALRALGTAMFSVMMVDWALYLLLSKFGLKADVAAGHSMGELVALGTSGYLDTDATFFERVNTTIDQLETSDVDGYLLLAVGAGKETVQALVQQEVFVAMCNCPHQCVAVGKKEDMLQLEQELSKKSILFEKLPFTRPYHTKLFAPLLKNLDAMFDGVEFREGKTPVYSCSRAALFPKEPQEIRRLAVAHWAEPVEFTKMIEQMYADGARIFVEVGPRGNLTSFVADILHNKPHLAIAANKEKRSGITQLHHLLAQLIAQGVPLDLTELHRHRTSPQSAQKNEVMAKYFDVMEQFLDLEEQFMTSYLAARREKVQMPLVKEVIGHEPQKSLTIKRTLDLAEDLFSTHHTVGGRTLSKVEPTQYGLPIAPGTFSLEMCAEAASLLFPGLVVIEIKNVRFQRWLAYESNPTIEIRANVVGPHTVQVEIYDLTHNHTAFRAQVVLAPSYPEAPSPTPFTLTNERPCKVTIPVLRQNLFHGPIFEGMLRADRFGDEGVSGTIEVLPRDAILGSTTTPNFILDPVLLDVSMHPLVAWHLEHEDQSGRILLPAEIESLKIYGPILPVGTKICSRGWINDSSSRHFTHTVEAVSTDEKLLFTLRSAKFWRFYVPFDKVNFHGPKDEYFLSRKWHDCMRLDIPKDLRQPGMRLVTAKVSLSPEEQREFSQLMVPEERKDEWLFGRIVAKDAVRTAWRMRHGEKLFLADVIIDKDAHGKPTARYRDPKATKVLPAVSISHTEGIVVAISDFSPAIGLDIERLKPRDAGFEAIAFSDEEKVLLARFEDRNEAITRFWCAKEAISKALGIGLVDGPKSFCIHDLDKETLYVMHEKIVYSVDTKREDDLIVATTLGAPCLMTL